MLIKVWGTRGSTPVSGDEYRKYGGETTCLEIVTAAGDVILLDAGTGLNTFARVRLKELKKTPILFLSHLHLDHVQGLPFFPPLYDANTPLKIYGPEFHDGPGLENGLARLFDGVIFPVRWQDLSPELHPFKPGNSFHVGSALVETIATNHPGGCVAWRITADGWTFAFSADHEINLDTGNIASTERDEALFDFLGKADVALVDGQYTEKDHKPGWGHSFFQQWLAPLASRGVKHLLFGHYNPLYTDPIIDELLSHIGSRFGDMTIAGVKTGDVIDANGILNSRAQYSHCTVCDFIERLSRYSDTHSLLSALLTKTREISQAEAGTVYLVENNELVFHSAQNDTLFPTSSANKFSYMNARININSSSLAGYVATRGEVLNIADVYTISGDAPYKFNDSFDREHNYRTTSTLVLPLLNSTGELKGVLQLINSRRADKPAPFSKQMEEDIKRICLMATAPLERTLMMVDMILRMLKTSELRDPSETGAHVHRVGSMAAEIYHHWAEEKSVEPEELLAIKGQLRIAAMLHDVGKVGIADAILKKPGRLDEEEMDTMRNHASLGGALFENSVNNIDVMAREIAQHHHARWDGNGYSGSGEIPSPGGEDIPFWARITAIADVYDALASKRCYKEAASHERALAILREGAGSHFDPELIRHFMAIQDTVKAIYTRYNEDEALKANS